MSRLTFEGPLPEQDDLHTQHEALLSAVYRAEENWDLDDRIDLTLGTPPEPRRDRTPRS